MNIISRFFRAGLLAIALVLPFSGCEDSGGGGGGGGGNSRFVGTWALAQGGQIVWYIHFLDDRTWNISNNADGSGRRAFGTYSVNGNTARGPMQNPGTGVGEIVATLNGGTMTLDFIEHWHTPFKTLTFTGVKL